MDDHADEGGLFEHGSTEHEDAYDEEDVPEAGEQLAKVISLLVDTPDEVQVDLRRERSVDLFRVRVDADDLGQLIGRQGRTARALRTLLDVRGSRDDRRYGLEIREY